MSDYPNSLDPKLDAREGEDNFFGALIGVLVVVILVLIVIFK